MRRVRDTLKDVVRSMVRNRRSRRLDEIVPVHIIRCDRKYQAFATGINRHGLFIHTPLEADLNYLVQLEVHLPTGPLKVLATAKSKTGKDDPSGIAGLGVEFFAIDSDSKSAWEDYYQQLMQNRTAG